MKDPFQDVDSFGSDFVDVVVQALEVRAAEEHMIPIVERYLDDLNWERSGVHLEIGTGSGAIARRMALRAVAGTVIGLDPSEGLISVAKELGVKLANLTFEVADGGSTRFSDSSIDSVVMHTVLSHVPDPAELLEEAFRVLKSGGRLVVSDADFEKTSFGNFEGDPLKSCGEYFIRNFVTRPYLISEIRKLTAAAGFAVHDFRVDSRVTTETDGGLVLVKMSTNQMVEQGLIAEELANALMAEYTRRRDGRTLYGHQPFGTLVASKP